MTGKIIVPLRARTIGLLGTLIICTASDELIPLTSLLPQTESLTPGRDLPLRAGSLQIRVALYTPQPPPENGFAPEYQRPLYTLRWRWFSSDGARATPYKKSVVRRCDFVVGFSNPMNRRHEKRTPWLHESFQVLVVPTPDRITVNSHPDYKGR